VPSGEFHLQRAYPGVPEGQATFGTLRCAHLAGIRFDKLDQKTFTFSVRTGFFRKPDLPARIEAKLPSACIVAALAGLANHFGYRPFTVFPLSRHNEPYNAGPLNLQRRRPYLPGTRSAPCATERRHSNEGAGCRLVAGGFVFLDPGGANEEYARRSGWVVEPAMAGLIGPNRLPRGCTAECAGHNPRSKARPSLPAGSRGKFVRHQFAERQYAQYVGRCREPEKRQRRIPDAQPAQLCRPTGHRRPAQRTKSRYHINQKMRRGTRT
jgi:hypothetical protein